MWVGPLALYAFICSKLNMLIFTYSPAQIINKRIGPKKFVGIIMTGFGVVTMCTAFSFNFGGIVTCRMMLGIFEAGLFPGVIYMLR